MLSFLWSSRLHEYGGFCSTWYYLFINFTPYFLEIHRIPLESIILQIKALNLGDPRTFPFIETPPAQSIEESILVLRSSEKTHIK